MKRTLRQYGQRSGIPGKAGETTHIGTIQGIDVLERNEGGAIEKLRIRGEKETIEVCTEYNVRVLS